jgi:plastocyanin
MKRILIFTLLTLVALAGVFLVVTGNNRKREQSITSTQSTTAAEQQSAPTPKIETVTVTYTDDGFSPQNIEIARGSTVNFVNKSSMPLWVASDPHPEHTDYPEFDTLRGRDGYPQMGEDFSYTFEKTGTWKYHSHTASGDVSPVAVHPGTVTVK